MFDTEKFIEEVHIRECIWNANVKEYCEKPVRRKAWEEIASVTFPDWGEIGTKKKNETIHELQKKWKHLRDYFVREKNKQKRGGAPKKRRAPFLQMLQFLDVSPVSSPANKPYPNGSNSSCDSNEDTGDSTHMDKSWQQSPPATTSKALTVFPEMPECLVSMNTPEQYNMNPHMNFLLSLLPEMQTMSERQLFEFKFEIMKVIQKIKYSND